MLNDDQIKKFKEDGFVLFRNLFDKSEIKKILKYTEKLQDSPEVSGKEWKFFENSEINKNEKVLILIFFTIILVN